MTDHTIFHLKNSQILAPFLESLSEIPLRKRWGMLHQLRLAERDINSPAIDNRRLARLVSAQDRFPFLTEALDEPSVVDHHLHFRNFRQIDELMLLSDIHEAVQQGAIAGIDAVEECLKQYQAPILVTMHYGLARLALAVPTLASRDCYYIAPDQTSPSISIAGKVMVPIPRGPMALIEAKTALQDGYPVSVAIDEFGIDRKNSIDTSVLGVQLKVPRGIFQLACMVSAPIVPVVVYWRHQPECARIALGQPTIPTASPDHALHQILAALEPMMQVDPLQWVALRMS